MGFPLRLLLIDTCGVQGTVALAYLLSKDASVAEAVVAMDVLPGRSSSERLIPAVRTLLEGQGWRLDELAAIVVVHGPGSFTGVRVGLSAAKGLSEASGVPLIAVSRLALVAGAPGRVQAALDAGRGEFYYGEYVDGHCVMEALLTLSDVTEAVGSEVVIVCEGRAAEALREQVSVRVIAEPGAADAVAIAVKRIVAGEFDDAAVIDANYLRRTDAQLFARPMMQAAK